MAIAKEQLRQIIRENDLKSVGDVYTLLKDSFRDILQELLEAEMDAISHCSLNSNHLPHHSKERKNNAEIHLSCLKLEYTIQDFATFQCNNNLHYYLSLSDSLL